MEQSQMHERPEAFSCKEYLLHMHHSSRRAPNNSTASVIWMYQLKMQ